MKYRIRYDKSWNRWVLTMRNSNMSTSHYTFNEARMRLWHYLNALKRLGLRP